jgi:hypothetical protein
MKANTYNHCGRQIYHLLSNIKRIPKICPQGPQVDEGGFREILAVFWRWHSDSYLVIQLTLRENPQGF